MNSTAYPPEGDPRHCVLCARRAEVAKAEARAVWLAAHAGTHTPDGKMKSAYADSVAAWRAVDDSDDDSGDAS